MATGTGNLPNTGMSFTPFDILTAAEMNDLVENIEALADGSGLGDGAVTAPKIDFTTFEYSTTEKIVGKWVDGKNVYQKTINFGALPNTTSKSVNHSITGLDKFIRINGVTSDGTNFFPLPFSSTVSVANNIQVALTSTQVTVNTGTDRSSYTWAYITLYYTKV